ncbi:uncharacterized protein C2845_PM16G01880 [Panicum miliaceum]|uniref:Retrotransposon Copia-like N-terminal domain-containing protein n=1 Tax=Panicum miliaceum TaxID=4540 RepID=A0A3L6PUC6_PANMI|nr:uncharacterized protein C2845_PM16G01880 [Panicum miliaceum]
MGSTFSRAFPSCWISTRPTTPPGCARSLFFGQYDLGDHIDGTAPPQGNSDWVQNDSAIVSWLYNRLAPNLLTAVSTNDDTAYSLWRGVREIFRDNRSARAVYLNAEFRTFL